MRLALIFVSFLFIAACDSQLQTSATLNSTQDIDKGESIYFSDEIVGEVTEVKQLTNSTQLMIELNDQGETLITQNAAIVINRLKSNSPLEIYNKQTETELIQEGSELTGLNSMLELGAWMVGDSISTGGDSLLSYVNAFQRYLDGEQFQQDKQQLQDAAQKIGKEVEGLAETLDKEVQRATTNLSVAEKQAAQAIEQLGSELGPVIGELSKSSQAVVNELEKFTENIESQSLEGQALGSTVLSSLLKALETVNENIESANPEPNEPFQPIKPESWQENSTKDKTQRN